MNASAISSLMPIVDGFPRPNWEAIQNKFDDVEENEAHETWCEIGRTWLKLSAETIGKEYSVSETENFLILASLKRRELDLLLTFVERSRSTILQKLVGIAQDEGYGKNVLLLFKNDDDYYKYISYFYAREGEFPMSSGMFLNGDYGHIVIPFFDMYETEATFAHEFTHCCLCHLAIPLWLNEGLAVTLEDELCGNRPLRMDKERMSEHQEFWDATTIQQFWNGESFQRADEGNELSYELARYCVKAIAHDLREFSEFVNLALYEDGGEAAAIQVYEGSLGGLPYQFFGEGDWIPKPDSWTTSEDPPNKSLQRMRDVLSLVPYCLPPAVELNRYTAWKHEP